MKSELWSSVKVGDLLIRADQYDGVRLVKVVGLDIHFYEPSIDPSVPSRFSYPYGLTKDFGTVEILRNTDKLVVNLADLILYSKATLEKLQKAYSDYYKYLELMESYKSAFLALIVELK